MIQASAFDPLAPGSAATLVLSGARVGGLLLIMPAFSAAMVPRSVRAALLVILTVLVQPVALATLRTAPRVTPAAVITECIVGFAIGLGAALLIGAAEAAGDIMAVQTGLSGSALLDPLDVSQMPSLGIFTRLFAIALLFSFDFHHVMLRAVADSFDAVPIGAPVALHAGLRELVTIGGALFAYGVRFAAPVIAAVLISNVALAILGRAAPQLNFLVVAFPVQILVGLAAILATLPAMARFFSAWATVHEGMLAAVFRGLTLAGAP